jgi:hypothetical protein
MRVPAYLDESLDDPLMIPWSYHDLDLGGLGPDLPVASPEVAG